MARRTTGRPAQPGPDDFSTSATYRMNPYLDISQMPTGTLNPPLPEGVSDEVEEALDLAQFATEFIAPRDVLRARAAHAEQLAREHDLEAIRERMAAREAERDLVDLCEQQRLHVTQRNLLYEQTQRRRSAQQQAALSRLDDLIIQEYAEIARCGAAVAHMRETARRHVDAAQFLRRNHQNSGR